MSNRMNPALFRLREAKHRRGTDDFDFIMEMAVYKNEVDEARTESGKNLKYDLQQLLCRVCDKGSPLVLHAQGVGKTSQDKAYRVENEGAYI